MTVEVTARPPPVAQLQPLFGPAAGLLSLALASALGSAPGPRSAAWLARCAGWTDALPEPQAADLDVLLDQVWRGRGRVGRRALGQVFTPRNVARQLLLEMPEAAEGELLDPACGGGVFLVEAVALRAERLGGRLVRDDAARILSELHGLDLDADVCRLARLLVGLAVVTRLDDAEAVVDTLPLPSIECVDATDPKVVDRFGGRVRAVVGNPPYREAKGMPSAERDWLRGRFSLEGAFDLYLAFLLLAMEIVGSEGSVGYVLPNKFLVARYANRVRQQLLRDRQVHAVVDLSEVDVFGKVGVYPILLVLGPARHRYRSVFAVPSDAALGEARLDAVEIDAGVAASVLQPPTLWTAPPGPLAGLLQRLGEHPRLDEWVEVRSTCSFHATGLRERFVRPSDELPDGVPYLGGRSFAKRNEVQPFGVDWQDYRIRYAEDELRELGNPLPPLSRFLRPKVVLCQHGRSVIGWFDELGVYVTKDVYPIAVARSGRADEAAALTALLNSRVFSVVYALLYRGIAVSGGYLHMLPAFLNPVPAPRPRDVERLAADVLALQAERTVEAWEALDDAVSELYGLTDAEHDAVRRFADERLRFRPNPFAR